jgi:DNA-binding LacI/PurR family transcriptional regulator
VVDFLHVNHPQTSWDRRISVEEGTKVIAVYGRAALAEWATRRGVPMLFLGGDTAGFPVPKVAVSSARMAGEAMDRLIALGHRRIVLPLCDRSHEFKVGLREVTRRAVERAGDSYVAGYHNPESDYNAPDVMRRILANVFSRRTPTALILLDWKETVAVSCFLTERGLRVPRDVSLVMLSDSVTAEWFHPKLCRFRYPQRRMLSEMVKWLEDKPGSAKASTLSGIFESGESIAAPPKEMA